MESTSTMQRLAQVHHDFFGRVWGYAQALPVHPRQGPMLSMLLRHDGATQSDVARQFDIAPATVAVSVARLEKLGLLRREPLAGDSRVNCLYLTPEGREMAQKLEDALRQVEIEALEGFTPEERETLNGYLGRIQERLQANHPKEQKRCKK